MGSITGFFKNYGKSILSVGGIVAIVCGVIYGLGYAWFGPMNHWLMVIFRFLLPFLLVIAATLLLMAVLMENHTGFAVLVGIIGAGVLIFLMASTGYFSARAEYEASSVKRTGDANGLSYKERAPYDVASNAASRNLGATNGDSYDKLTYLPGEGMWTSTVNRRGIGVGYDRVQKLDIPTIGSVKQSDVSFCSFSPTATRSLQGSLWKSSMAVQIARQTGPSVTYSRDDAFAVCSKGKPYVYVPLTTLKGFLFPYRVPAGVAVYDGTTGGLTVRKDATIDGYPIYPISVAASQRESVKANGSLWDWWMNNVGYEDTSGDGGDPNASNSGEFSLESTNGVSQYVSPLTPRGSSSSIVAVGTVDSDAVKSGSLAPMTLHMFPEGSPREANTAVSQSIINDSLAGYKATNLKVMEIVPAAKGEWTATIGAKTKAQSTLYRATVTSNGDITLRDERGNIVAGTDDVDGEGPANEVGGDTSPDSDPKGESDSNAAPAPAAIPGSVKPPKPLSKMTPKELSDWSKTLLSEVGDVNAELASRAQTNTK